MVVIVNKYSFWALKTPKTVMISRALWIKITRVAHLEPRGKSPASFSPWSGKHLSLWCVFVIFGLQTLLFTWRFRIAQSKRMSEKRKLFFISKLPIFFIYLIHLFFELLLKGHYLTFALVFIYFQLTSEKFVTHHITLSRSSNHFIFSCSWQHNNFFRPKDSISVDRASRCCCDMVQIFLDCG